MWTQLLWASPHRLLMLFSSFFFIDPATTEIYTLSLHDALPISASGSARCTESTGRSSAAASAASRRWRSEEHTSELQSHSDLVCRLLLEKKKKADKLVLRDATKIHHELYDIELALHAVQLRQLG